ncbi:MAG: DUF3649 domain-containing protein [Blastocatellia bacterium]
MTRTAGSPATRLRVRSATHAWAGLFVY